MNPQWTSLLDRTINAVDNLSQAERDKFIAKIEADPSCVVYTRDQHGWIEVFIGAERIARCHVYDLPPAPDAPFLH